MAKQKNLSITEFGRTVEQLAAKLATAHVSARTFQSEARADAIVQPAAINAFITGLNNPQTAFFVKARNPPSLNRAISDALEVLPINKQEEVNWYHAHTSGEVDTGMLEETEEFLLRKRKFQRTWFSKPQPKLSK